MAEDKAKDKALKLLSKYKSIEKKTVSTGILGLDILWNGGIALGGTYGIGSQQGAGKSTICLTLARHFIEHHKYNVAYIDVEQGVSDKQLESLGLLKYKDNELLLIQNALTFNDLQEVCDSIITLATEKNIKLVIVDSLNQISTEVLTEQTVESRKIAPYAKPMSEWIRNVKGRFGVAGISCIILGQAGANIGASMWDPEWYVKLPYAVLHGVDIMTYIEHSPFKKDQIYADINTPNGVVSTSIGYWGKFWTSKNRDALQDIKIRIPVIMGKGIDNILYLKECLLNTEEITKYGEKYKISFNNEQQTFNGDAQLVDFLVKNYEILIKRLKDKGYFDLRNNATIIGVNSNVDINNQKDEELSDEKLLADTPEGTVIVQHDNKKCAKRPDGNIITYIDSHLCCWSNKELKWIEC